MDSAVQEASKFVVEKREANLLSSTKRASYRSRSDPTLDQRPSSGITAPELRTMHVRDYRFLFAKVRSQLCLVPPDRPLTFVDIARLTIEQAATSRIHRMGHASLHNLISELWMWNRKRFSRTCSLLFHRHLRRGDALIYL